jgi:predicted DNA-binding transcriptional regulator AlpA
MPTPAVEDEFLTERDLTAELRMKPQSLAMWRTQGRGPAYVKLGQLVRYRRSDVEIWLKSRVVRGGS